MFIENTSFMKNLPSTFHGMGLVSGRDVPRTGWWDSLQESSPNWDVTTTLSCVGFPNKTTTMIPLHWVIFPRFNNLFSQHIQKLVATNGIHNLWIFSQDILFLRFVGLPVPCMTYRLLKHQLANKAPLCMGKKHHSKTWCSIINRLVFVAIEI